MILKLKDISAVSSGATFRSRIETALQGSTRVIQMKDLGSDNVVNLKDALRIDQAKLKPNQLAERGDLIFRSRGQTNTAALMVEEVGNVIVAAPLFRVRPDTSRVMPEYLLWWINQKTSQNYLASRSKGTTVKMVSKQGLEELAVILPSLEQQSKMAKYFTLALTEQRLLKEIKECKSRHTQGVLMQMAAFNPIQLNARS